MAEKTDMDHVSPLGRAALENMHKLFLEALRHREQEIVRYLALLVPALGGFIWLVHKSTTPVSLLAPDTVPVSPISDSVFAVGSLGILSLLFLGAVYSLALGYNFRYIILQLAKLEAALGIRGAMLKGWPRSRKEFLDRYKIFCHIPWCTPPEMIKVFWWAFLTFIAGVMLAACLFMPKALVLSLVIPSGAIYLLLGVLAPVWYGRKLRDKCKQEPEHWSALPNAEDGAPSLD